jgi:thymidine kinase
VLVGATGLYEARCRHCFDPDLAADSAKTAAAAEKTDELKR